MRSTLRTTVGEDRHKLLLMSVGRKGGISGGLVAKKWVSLFGDRACI